jgi:hypothetical protein
VQLAGGQQLLIPFGENAHLVWTRTNGQTAAVGLVRQGKKTLNVSADGQERLVRFLPVQKVEKLLRKLREKSKFQGFEGKLAQKGKRVGKVRVLFDETNKIAILGIASEGSEEKIAHQVRIKLKAGKDDEPEDDAEPAIQATACGQATGEAVPEGAKMQPLTAPPGKGDIGGGYEGPQICTSQWGYSYICSRFNPLLQVETPGPLLLATFIGGQARASFTIWNAGGRTLTGSATVTGPFTILSGGSFSLAPGQPQKIVVGFNPSQIGRFLGEVRFTNSTIKVYLEGKAYTFEEYLQLLVEFYNQLNNLSRNPSLPQRPAPPTLYIPAAKSFAFGFERLSTYIAEQMVQIANELQGQLPSPQTTPSSSDSAVSEIELALQELSLYVNDPSFPQHLERVKTQYPGFAVFLENLASWLGQEAVSVARNMAHEWQQQPSLRQRFDTIIGALKALGVIRSPLPGENLTCGISGQTYPCSEATRYLPLEGFYRVMVDHPLELGFSSVSVALTILDNFLSAIEYILGIGQYQGTIGVAPGTNKKTLMTSLLNAIPYMNVSIFPPGGSAPSVAAIRDFVSLAQLLGNMVVHGRVDGQPAQWQFYAFNLNAGGNRIEIIATIQISAFRDPSNPRGLVTIFANTFDFFGESRNNIIDEAVRELNAAIKYIKEHEREYGGRNIAVGFVRSQIDDSTADSIMSRLDAGAPVLLVYCVANCDSGSPVYHLRYRGMNEQQAKALACALGFTDFCGRYAVVETGPPWDSREEELCPTAMIGSDCSDPPPSNLPPMP